MLLLISVAYTAIPKRDDALLTQPQISPIIEASGSLGIRFRGQCLPTFPNQTIIEDDRMDWCSNIMKTTNDNPWISYRLTNKAMKIRGYSVRNGCCHYVCCCDPETDLDIDIDCCCRLYSFSLQGSNDNKTWKTIHKVEKDNSIRFCELKTYEFDLTQPFNIVRFVMDEEFPRCLKCLQVNQIELYGKTISSDFYTFEDDSSDDNDESISIIGKVKKY